MKQVVLAVWAMTMVLTGTAWAQDPPVPQEWQGIYAGVQKGKNHRIVPPSSFSESVNLVLDENTCLVTVQNENGGASLTGTAMSNGVLVFYRADVAGGGLALGARLKAVGKPGKMKLSGPSTLLVGQYPMIADVKVKLKQLPIIP